MHAVHRFAVSIALALVVGGAAQEAAGGVKSYAPARRYLATGLAAGSCAVGSTTRLCIPVDSTFSVAVFSDSTCAAADPADPCSRNDDSFTAEIALPFTFQLYGQAYTRLYINNNGNLSFGSGYCAFSSYGFPVGGFPMVAPFWADVDTRHPASGGVHYRLDPHKIVVAWDHVGYFEQQADKTNTFEVILSDGTDPAVSIGNNVCFCYGDMQWTTGGASDGIDGFRGVPATVGVNAGDGENFFQIGRFDHAGADYDGPGGASDGVDYLDDQHFCANVSGLNIPPVAIGFGASLVDSVFVGDSLVVNTSFAAPELGQTTVTSVDLNGLANATAATVSGNLSTQRIVFHPAANQVGLHAVRYVAVDDGAPADTTTVDLTLVVTERSGCSAANHAPQFVSPTPACGASVQVFVNELAALPVRCFDADSLDVVTLSATGIPGDASLSTALPFAGNPVGTVLTWTPTAADTGTHLVALTASDGCDSASCSLLLRVLARDACPRTSDDWAEHRPAWPADSLRLGDLDYGPEALARFLGARHHRGHEHDGVLPALRLAGELVAAKFNRLIGADAPGVEALVAQADSLIGDHVVPFEIRCGRRGDEGDDAHGRSPRGSGGNDCERRLRRFEQATAALAKFNSGGLSPNCRHGHHDDDDDEDGGDRHARASASAAALAAPEVALEFTADARPNPFRGATTIVYTLPKDADVRIAVYDLQGRELRVLAEGHMAAGLHQALWDGTDPSGQRLRSGVYFYRLIAGPYTTGKKLVVRQ